MSDELRILLASAPAPSPEDREEQRRSFAYGNAAMENEHVTRDMIDRAAGELAAEAKAE